MEPADPSTLPAASQADGPRASLKERVLDATLQALRELTTEDLLTSIGVAEIARRADASRASIYHHYGSLGGLAEAVTDRVYNPAAEPVDRILALVDDIADSQVPLESSLALNRAELHRVTNDPNFSLRMGLWAFGNDRAHRAYRHYLRSIDDQVGTVSSAVWKKWGRNLRPPFDIKAYIAARVALLNGAALRQLVEPDALTPDQYTQASICLDLILHRVEGDHNDTNSRLAEINYYPVAPARSNIPDTQRARNTNARILNATASLFTSRGYDNTTFELIASRSDTSMTTLKRYYPTKHQLALALFRQQLNDDLLAGPTSGEQGRPPRAGEAEQALHRHLEALAAFAPPRAAQATAYLREVLTTAEYADPLIDRTHDLLSVHDHVGGAGTTSYDTSRLLTGLTVRNALHNPAAHPAGVAQSAIDALVIC